MFHQYPYTNFHELNLDWFLKEFRDYYYKVDAIVKGQLNEHLLDLLSSILFDAIYIPETKTIKLSVVAKDGVQKSINTFAKYDMGIATISDNTLVFSKNSQELRTSLLENDADLTVMMIEENDGSGTLFISSGKRINTLTNTAEYSFLTVSNTGEIKGINVKVSQLTLTGEVVTL